MTPKEKAKELIEKFYKIKLDFIYVHDNDSYVGNENMTYKSAVKCAIIEVDGIINYEKIVLEQFPSDGFQPCFWQQVKTELELELKN